MREYVLASFDEQLQTGQAEARALADGDRIHLQLTRTEDAALGVFTGLDELGQLPTIFGSVSAYSQTASAIGSKLTQLDQAGVDIRVGGDFNYLIVALGDGADRVSLSAQAQGEQASIYGRGGADTLLGSAARDVLQGDDGDDRLSGRGGDDLLVGNRGADHMDGGEGVDGAMFWLAPHKLVVDLAAPGVNVRGDGGDTLVNVENISGSALAQNWIAGDGADNNLIGGSTKTVLYGRDGDDVLTGSGEVTHLNGGDGDDMLYANGYRDIMTGGAGADTFHIPNVYGPIDHITDFEAGDRIDLSLILADASGNGPEAFRLVDHIERAGDAALVVHARHGFAVLLLNVDADLAPDATIRIEGLPTAADFVL